MGGAIFNKIVTLEMQLKARTQKKFKTVKKFRLRLLLLLLSAVILLIYIRDSLKIKQLI